MTRMDYRNILTVDTATRRLVLALAYGEDRLVKSSDAVEKSHGVTIIKKIDELLQSAAMSSNELEAAVVSLGPGSFTGLRIGLAVIKGIAVAAGIPVVGVNMFELSARKLSQQLKRAHVLIPSRKGEVYVGTLCDGVIAEKDIAIVAETDLLAHVGGDKVFGVGFDPGHFFEELPAGSAVGELEYDGADLLYLGKEKLERGEQADLTRLEPMYLQKAIAEVRFDGW